MRLHLPNRYMQLTQQHMRERTIIEEHEPYVANSFGGGKELRDGFYRYLGRLLDGVAMDAGGDAGEGDAGQVFAGGEGEGFAVAGGQLGGFVVVTASPDWADGV